MQDLIVVGGGASGFFGALNFAENCKKPFVCTILEQGGQLLQKVKISGGGRCNVTHAEFVPKPLTYNYPRGEKELLGPFTKFCTGDTMEWFEKRGIELKIEEDGRVFPSTDDSQTIIDTFLNEAKKHNIKIRTKTKITKINHQKDHWILIDKEGNKYRSKHVLLATGSTPSAQSILDTLGIKLVAQVPSLFTFKVKDSDLHDLKGLSVPTARVSFENISTKTTGPLLITHWGLSGPSILKASAQAAIELHQCDYNTTFYINWINVNQGEALSNLKQQKEAHPKNQISSKAMYNLPKRLWAYLVNKSQISLDKRYSELNKSELERLSTTLTKDRFEMRGKTRFKEEFVTAGGVDLKEINFKSYEIKSISNLYVVGEALNIDGITGGFNFQAAWTSGYLAGVDIAHKINGAG